VWFGRFQDGREYVTVNARLGSFKTSKIDPKTEKVT
jgi:hypothetical protein